MENKKARKSSLDIIKILATFVIIFHHYQQVLNVEYRTGINFYGEQFNFGYFVELFFILSGFFMYRYINKIRNGISFADFFKKRYLRLIPVLIFGTILYQAIAYVYFRITGSLWGGHGFSLWSTVITCFGVQDGWVFTNPMINNPVWYISVLILCYIFFYLTTWLATKFNTNEYCLYITMILIGIGIHTYKINLPFFNFDAARGYYSFFTGIICANIFYNLKEKKNYIVVSFFAVIIISNLYIIAPNFVNGGSNWILTFILFPALVYLFFRIKKIPGDKIIIALSEISYCTYVIHLPFIICISILQIVKPELIPSFNSKTLMILFSLICFLFGCIYRRNGTRYRSKRNACR